MADDTAFTASPKAWAEPEQQPDGSTVWVVRVIDPLGIEHVLRSEADWNALKARWWRRAD